MANPIRQKEIDERIGRAAGSFWGAFQMTDEHGRVKSALLLYSFCLCWVFLLVYGGCFALFSRPLDALLTGMPIPVVNLIEALTPAIAGTAVCCLVWLLPGDKRLLPASYAWLTFLMLSSLIVLLFLMGWESAGLVLQFFAMFALAPLLLGVGASAALYYLYWKKRPPVADPTRPWKRQ